MPIIDLKISKIFTSEELQNFVNEITNLTVKHLKKQPELIAITVLSVERHNWFINSKSLENLKQDSFFLNIKVTESTNSKDDKSKYIASIFMFMRTVLVNIHSESYVYVEEAKADAYGYGGATQEYRYIKNQVTKSK